MAGDAPLGPRKFDLAAQHDEDFDELCFRLIRLEFRDAVKLRAPDGGADTLLPGPARETYERCWQAKRYPDKIHWQHCIESLDRAVKRYEPQRVTFCFPKNLTQKEEGEFKGKLVGRHPGVTVDYWNLSELSARLTATSEGERVAKHFFGEQPDQASLERAIRACGPLQTQEQATERSLAIGEFLKENDPYFSYPSGQREKSDPVPPPSPNTTIRVEHEHDEVISHTDAIARDPEALERFGPMGRLVFPDSERAKEIREQLDQLMRQGGEVELKEGVATFTLDRLPPLFQDYLDKPMTGRMRFRAQGVAQPPPWPARFVAKSDQGEATLEIDLKPVEAPEGWDVALRGSFGGMTATVLFRWDEQAHEGEVNFNWRYTMDNSAVREQVQALRLLAAFHGKGEVEIFDRSKGRPPMTQPFERPPPDDVFVGLLDLFENLATIEEWTGAELEIPEEISAEDAMGTAMVAKTVRDRGHSGRWEGMTFTIDPDKVPQFDGAEAIEIRHTLDARVLGQEVYLGPTVTRLPKLKVVDVNSLGDDPARACEVRVESASGEPAEIWIALREAPSNADEATPPS